MSALGHKQTFAVQNDVSALPPKADIDWLFTPNVRFVPIADIRLHYSISSSARPTSVFGMLRPKRLRGFEMDNQLGLGGLLILAKLAGLSPLRMRPVYMPARRCALVTLEIAEVPITY